MRKKKIEIKKIDNIFSNQKGMALLATLIFVSVLVTLGVSLLTMTSNDGKMSTLQRASTQAFYQAETGIEKAIWYLNFSSEEDNPDGLDFEGDLHGGTLTEFYDTTIGPIYDGPPEEIQTLVSTGKVVEGGEFNKGTRKIEVKLKKGIASSGGLSYSHAIFTNGDMTINGGVSVSGNIHTNADLNVSGTAFGLENGVATASGSNDYDVEGADQPEQDYPAIAWEYFQELAENGVDGGHYYDDDYTFDVSGTNLTGIHFIEGDVVIKADITLTNAAIFATGTITVLGNGDITLGNDLAAHPLALVAKGSITIGGSVHGEGIIQTEADFTNIGNVNIQEGAIYAELGVFNGGGGAAFNIVYGTSLADIVVQGTGIPVWIKISWREVY